MKTKIQEGGGIPVIFLDKIRKKSKLFTNTGFEAKSGQFYVIADELYVGTKGITSKNDWRVLGAKVIQKLKALKVKEANIELPEHCKEFVEGLFLGDYEFTSYKSKPEKPVNVKLNLWNGTKELKKIVKDAKAKAEAQFLTRDWVNTAPDDAHSETIEKAVRETFKGTDVKVTVYSEKELKKLGMEGHLAVNRASRHEAKTIKLTYEPTKYDKHHVFVGKGLTYDSGGLSIKPGNHMTTMKADKAGAMTVWGLMKYLSVQGCPHKVTAYMGIAENMIDGSAYKPDDVLTMKNGKTVHVKNTDAEGRLVLFDNLVLAEEENKDADTIHSLATLTGAAVYQFGDEAAGLVGFNDKLKKQVTKSGDIAGEVFMDAAFHRHMMDAVKDDLADLSNTGTANMGCQKAGLFLTNAIKSKNQKKYLHWDIAGPAFVTKGFDCNPAGATGFGVRTLIEYLK